MIQNILYTLLFITVIILLTVVGLMKSELNRKSAEIQNIRQLLRINESLYKEEIERSRKASQAVEKYVDKYSEVQSDHAQRIETIISDENACDWLDAPIPDIVRQQFCADDSKAGTSKRTY